MPTQTPVHTLSTQPVYDVAIVSLTLTDSKRLTTMLHQVTYDEAYNPPLNTGVKPVARSTLSTLSFTTQRPWLFSIPTT
jgi:hypothetical protein